jgi:hypothetical protein
MENTGTDSLSHLVFFDHLVDHSGQVVLSRGRHSISGNPEEIM